MQQLHVPTFKHRLKVDLFSLTDHHCTSLNLPPGDCLRLRFGHYAYSDIAHVISLRIITTCHATK